MAYSADTFSAGEQPTTAKWNKLWANDASFNDGSGIGTNAIAAASLATNAIYLGSTSITSSVGPTSASTSDVDVTGLTVTVTVPLGSRKILIMATGGDYDQSGGIGTVYGVIKIKESATVLNSTNVVPAAASLPHGWTVFALLSGVSPGSHTYKVAVANNSTGPTYTIGASATNPTMIAAFAM